MFESIDWAQIFLPATPFFEIVLRGSVTFFGLFVLLRIVMKRQTGTLGISDLLVIVLIADASQNAMASNYNSLGDGFVLVVTILCANAFIDWIGYKFPWFEKAIYPQPLQLVKDGQMILENLRRELITRNELMSQLRSHGVKDLENVKEAFMEGDGSLSIIPIEENAQTKNQPDKEQR